MERISWIDKVSIKCGRTDKSERRQMYAKYSMAERAQMVGTCAVP